MLITNLPSTKAFVLVLALAITGSAASRITTDLNEKHSNHHCELMSIYLTGTENLAAPIVIVLHGDAPFVNPGTQYAFGSNLADAVPGTRVFTMFRPRSADPYEARIGVERATAFSETYSLEVVDDIAGAIQSLQSHWKAPAVILVGGGRGAAAAAYVAALHPGLVQRAVLIRCPCDVPALTFHGAHSRRDIMSLLALHNLSPLQALDQMSKETKLTVIADTNDAITPAETARSYVARAIALGIPASMILISTRGPNILEQPVVIDEIAKAIAGK